MSVIQYFLYMSDVFVDATIQRLDGYRMGVRRREEKRREEERRAEKRREEMRREEK